MFTDASVVGCSWSALAARLDRDGVIGRWAAEVAGLADLSLVADLLTAWDDPHRTHQVGDGLAWLAAADGGDDPDALLMVLHLASPVVWRLVGQLRDLDPDVSAIVVAELCCQIRSYRWRTRRRGLLSNLELDTRAAVLAELRPSSREFPDRVERLTRTGDIAQATRSEVGREDIGLAEVLARGLEGGVPSRDIQFLLRAESAMRRRRVVQFAASQGIGLATVYRRRSQILARLRAAALSAA